MKERDKCPSWFIGVGVGPAGPVRFWPAHFFGDLIKKIACALGERLLPPDHFKCHSYAPAVKLTYRSSLLIVFV